MLHPQGTGGVYDVLHRFMLHPLGYWWYTWCSISLYATSPRVLVVFMMYSVVLCYTPRILVVYMMYYIVLCYTPQDTEGVYDVLHRSMLHPLWYWWSTWCTTSFNVTSPIVLVVYMVYYIVLCYIPQDTGGVYDVLHLFMLHPPEYWWCI